MRVYFLDLEPGHNCNGPKVPPAKLWNAKVHLFKASDGVWWGMLRRTYSWSHWTPTSVSLGPRTSWCLCWTLIRLHPIPRTLPCKLLPRSPLLEVRLLECYDSASLFWLLPYFLSHRHSSPSNTCMFNLILESAFWRACTNTLEFLFGLPW